MYLCLLALWVFCVARFCPRLIDVAAGLSDPISWVALFLFTVCLSLFWLLGGYYLMLAVFTLVDMRWQRIEPPGLQELPAVAILYATMNDFQEKAALSCVRQRYPRFHVFILDDSTDAESRARVDRFARQHAALVTVARRPDREGYKAGSLNHALRRHVRSFPYFAVADADSVLQPTFLLDLMPYFGLGNDIAFVQGSHRPNPEQHSQFARDLCLGMIPLWTVYYGPRNRFGNVIFLGHGGVIRYDVWEEVGGFPEIVSEDLGFSTRAARLGYRGYFAREVISYEDFPAGYQELRRQQVKYVAGGCEYLHRELRPFLLSPKVKWYEKLDVLLSCFSLFTPVLFLLFMLTYCVALPAFLCTWRPLAVSVGGSQVISFHVLALDRAIVDVWSWDFYLLTILSTLAPGLGCLGLTYRYHLRAVKTFLLSAVPYLSLMVAATVAVMSYLLSRRAVFVVTGDRHGHAGKPRSSIPSASRLKRTQLTRTGLYSGAAEIALGVILMTACVVTLNLHLLAVAACVFLGPVLCRTRWESGRLRAFLYAPFILICTGLALLGLGIVTGQQVVVGLPLCHAWIR